MGKVESYRNSSDLIMCFCGTCGTSVYELAPASKQFGLCSGALDAANGIIELKEHMFVAATKDGGLREWLLDIPAWEMYRQDPSGSIEPGKAYGAKASATSNTTEGDILHCSCHCKGVQFNITRPGPRSSMLHSPWPDLLMPYFENASDNSADVKWWIRAGGTKYLAGTCACNSCRRGSGYDIQCWAFVPKVNIQKTNRDPIDFDLATLKRYTISEGAYREFCGKCGAVVFWHGDERPDLVDVSVGLLNARSGARAEEWLEWCTGRVSFQELAQNKSLIEKLAIGIKDWGARRTANE
ncbi:hypothetical protein MMC17_010229 [Xylographa soralifera]|nr:hypothetical protein [Xylographa soralifera]